MTHSNTPTENAEQTISIPGYTGKLPRFQGNQPLFSAARFQSLEEIAWGYASFRIDSIGEIDQPELEELKGIGYDCDPETSTAFMPEDLDSEYERQFKWGATCGCYQDEVDIACIVRSRLTKTNDDGEPIDNYWEICVINRDQPEFWTYLISKDPMALGVQWMQSFVDPMKEITDWAMENPDTAERWLLAEPTPHKLIGPDPDLDKLISKIKRAIRRGRID